MVRIDETCCFTGHRDVPEQERAALYRSLEETVAGLVERGYRYFGTGGAVGFDTMAAQTILKLRDVYSEIKLILILPCEDQDRNFRRADAEEYRRIKAAADKVRILHDHYVPGCMLERNMHMVKNSSLCVAYCRSGKGGTAYTVRAARRAGLEMIML